MATTNLISKSLGNVLTQSGNGVPDHTSPAGSLYSDIDSGILYQNSNGTTAWFPLQTVAYGEGYYQESGTTTTIGTINTWVGVGNTFLVSDSVGVSGSTNTLVLKSGYDGRYEVRGDVTISYVAGTNNYEVGLSVNNVVPAAGTYGSATIDVTYTRQHIGFQTIVNLVGGDNLRLAVRNTTSTNGVIIRHAQLFLRKVN
jgi:hypothetical protein